MSGVGYIVAEKIRLMDEKIKFLEYAWSLVMDKDKVINNYTGLVPSKYK